MLFNSYIFVFLFYPICQIGYYGLLRARKTMAAKVFLIAMSFWFYGWFNVSYLLIMVCSIGGNYLLHRALSVRERGAADTGRPERHAGAAFRHETGSAPASALRRKAVLILAVILNLGVLFYLVFRFLSRYHEYAVWHFCGDAAYPAAIGDQFFYIPADLLYCRHVSRGSVSLFSDGLRIVRLLLSTVDRGTDR